MKIAARFAALSLLLLPTMFSAHAQGNSTDVRRNQLYVFGGMTGTYTGLSGGRNLGITAGVDIGFGGYFGILPTLEVRGNYPVDSGTIDGQRSGLVGLKVEKPYRRFHPYVDVLFGRGQVQYQGAGYVNPSQTVLYQRTNSNIIDFGGGVDYDLTDSFAFKADVQYQSWDVPVTTSGKIHPTPITVGVLYRFGYRDHHPY